MYLKQAQLRQIRNATTELADLASLKNCALKDEIKDEIKLWVMWIDVYAQQINDAINGDVLEKFKD